MARYRTYCLLLYASITIVTVAFFATAIYLEPNSGDLTRMGGYPENWYGWTQLQTRFPQPLYARDNYNQYHDVVVFGDSFSTQQPGEQTDLGTYWQNFLARDTGLSVTVFNLRNTDFRSIIDNSVYAKRPPRIFIFENIERDIIYIPSYTRMKDDKSPCTSYTEPVGNTLTTTSYAIEPVAFERSTVYRTINRNFPLLDLDQAANLWKKRLLNDVFSITNQRVGRVNLTRTDLFSSHHSDKLLFYKNELLKKKWRIPQIDSVRCKLIALQNLIQSNGKTYFLLMIPPDRLTAYGPYLKEKSYADMSKLEQFIDQNLHLARVDLAIASAIEKGVVDVYLPNDTHWGVNGHMIAAEETIKTLRNHKIIH